MQTLLCPWEASRFLIFSSNVPNLLYYSLIPGMVTSVFFSFFVYIKDRKAILSQIFLLLSVLFFSWGFFNLILYATNDPHTVMWFWSLAILVEIAIYLLAFYMAVVFFDKKDLSNNLKKFLMFLAIPVLIVLPTQFNLLGVNLLDCTGIEHNFIVYYTYGLEIFVTLLIIIFSFERSSKMIDRVHKREVLYFTIGISFFLLILSSGNIVGSITDNWNISQLGYFGMPVFIGLLAYLVVKYKTFNIKVFATEALVWGLIALIGSQFLFITTNLNIILNSIAFIASILFGNMLIDSVKKQISQNERLEQLRLQLEQSVLETSNANEKLKGLDKLKTEFLSLASHQLRTPLTAIKGYASMLDEGGYGTLAPGQDEVVRRIYTSAQSLANLVEDLLNVSKIEQGGMKYEFSPVELKKIMMIVYHDMEIPAKNKGIDLKLVVDENQEYTVNADATKIKQVILNLIDNSIKYTPKGFVEVSLKKNPNNTITFAVRDSGVGITAETKEKLFQKFSRGEGGKLNTGGSGLGLYLAREIAIAHKGDIDIQSEGQDKGATFAMTLPMITN